MDELGGLEAAIAKASDLAGLEAPRIQRIPERKSFLEALFAGMDDPDMAKLMKSLGLDEDAMAPLLQLQLVTNSGGPIVLLPGYLQLH